MLTILLVNTAHPRFLDQQTAFVDRWSLFTGRPPPRYIDVVVDRWSFTYVWLWKYNVFFSEFWNKFMIQMAYNVHYLSSFAVHLYKKQHSNPHWCVHKWRHGPRGVVKWFCDDNTEAGLFIRGGVKKSPKLCTTP